MQQEEKMGLKNEEKERYQRQILLKEIGNEGQEKLKNSSCLVIGAGGLGSPVCFYLAAVGIGHIGVMDGDRLEPSNLNRQIIHKTKDLGEFKAASAREKMLELNPNIKVTAYCEFLTYENADEILKDYDFVVDATDNFKAKFLINEVCVRNNKAFVYAGISNFKGQLMTVLPHKSPCLKCIFTDEALSEENNAVERKATIGAIVGVIASLESLEAIKYLLGIGELLTGKMLIVDGLSTNIRKVTMPERNEHCESCGA